MLRFLFNLGMPLASTFHHFFPCLSPSTPLLSELPSSVSLMLTFDFPFFPFLSFFLPLDAALMVDYRSKSA